MLCVYVLTWQWLAGHGILGICAARIANLHSSRWAGRKSTGRTSDTWKFALVSWFIVGMLECYIPARAVFFSFLYLPWATKYLRILARQSSPHQILLYIFFKITNYFVKKIRRIHTNSPHCPKKCACVPGPQVALVIVTDMLWRQWTGRKSNQQHHDKHRTGKPPNCFEKPTNIHEETTAWHASRSTKESCWFWLRSANFERQGLENEN